MQRMEALFTSLAAGFGALFVVAIAVACWEHLLSRTRPPAAPVPNPAPHVASVDVQLDALQVPETPAQAPGDTARRRAALDGALGRMARARGETGRGSWAETSPMVLHGAPGPVASETTTPAAPRASEG